MIKGVQKYLELGKISKFHTLTQSWSKCMTCISLDPVFDLAILCDASMPFFHTYLKLHKKPLEVGWKEGKCQKPLVRTIHIEWSSESFWGAKLNFIFSKSNKTQVSEQKCSKGIWILTIPLSNHSRFYGRHSECSQVQVKLGITCIQISYWGDDPS